MQTFEKCKSAFWIRCVRRWSTYLSYLNVSFGVNWICCTQHLIMWEFATVCLKLIILNESYSKLNHRNIFHLDHNSYLDCYVRRTYCWNFFDHIDGMFGFWIIIFAFCISKNLKYAAYIIYITGSPGQIHITLPEVMVE